MSTVLYNFLVIDGVNIEITVDSGDYDVLEVGDTERAFDGELLFRVDRIKRVWNLSTKWLTAAEWAVWKNTIFAPGFKTCTGKLMDDLVVLCKLELKQIIQVDDGKGVTFDRVVKFQLLEI